MLREKSKKANSHTFDPGYQSHATQQTYTAFNTTNTHYKRVQMTPHETSLLLCFACMYEFKFILHVNAAVAHYQISLACLCNVEGSNVSEWEPGSEAHQSHGWGKAAT